MPTLDWIGKKAVLNHHREIPYRLLHCDRKLSAGNPDAGNLVVQGDNLEALKALLPYYGGQVKCIYIDPPYNTGVDERDEAGKRTGWIYSDNVNSPEISKWLYSVVGGESEDLTRHDKWLCMMYPRISLLREFLREDGTIFVSIDDTENATLRLLMDEIFGAQNRIGTLVWKNANDNNPTRIAIEHEYVICYAKNQKAVSKVWKAATLHIKEELLKVGENFISEHPDPAERQKAYSKWLRENRHQLWPFQDYKFIDENGIYTGMRAVHNPGKEGYRYDVIHPKTGKPCKEPMMGYRFPPETMNRLLEQNRIIFGENETKIVELKVYVEDYRAKLSSYFELDGRVGTNELKALFPESKRPFDFPKPTGLIEELLSFTTEGNDLVLDSFAGSGTTGHAVVKLNSADGHTRRFILIEMKQSIAESLTSERLRRVIHAKGGDPDSESSAKDGFRYCSLGKQLFDESGDIGENVEFSDLAAHIFFSETGVPIPKRTTGRTPFLGCHAGKVVYLLFNGVMGDKRPQGGNVLTSEMLKSLPAHDGIRVVYAEGCRLSRERLKREGVVFRQIPYEIKVR